MAPLGQPLGKHLAFGATTLTILHWTFSASYPCIPVIFIKITFVHVADDNCVSVFSVDSKWCSMEERWRWTTTFSIMQRSQHGHYGHLPRISFNTFSIATSNYASAREGAHIQISANQSWSHDEMGGELISTSRSIFAIPPLNFSSHRVPVVAAGGYLHCLSGAN